MEYTKRKSNFECLRIASIMMIIAFHYVWHGGFDFAYGGVTRNKLIYDILCYFGEWGVNVFILISGYFLPDMKVKKKKILRLALQALFYIILGRAVLVYLGSAEWSQWRVRDYFFPLLRAPYWFFGAYILIYFLSPFLKVMTENLSKKEFQRLLMVWFGVWSFYPTVIVGYVYGGTDIEAAPWYNRFIWLMGMFLCGCYIRMYGVPRILNSIRQRGIFLCGMMSLVGVYILAKEYGLLGGEKAAIYFWTPNSILEVLLSIALFLFFEKIELPYIKVINRVASCTLGIYMLHDGPLASVWWNTVFLNATHQNSRYFIVHIGIAVCTIMLIGIACEIGRQFVENRVVMPILLRTYLYCERLYEKSKNKKRI